MEFNVKFHLLRGLRFLLFMGIWGILVVIPTGIIIYPFSLIVVLGLAQQGNVAALSGVMVIFYVISIPLYCYFLSISVKYLPFKDVFREDFDQAAREKGVMNKSV